MVPDLNPLRCSHLNSSDSEHSRDGANADGRQYEFPDVT